MFVSPRETTVHNNHDQQQGSQRPEKQGDPQQQSRNERDIREQQNRQQQDPHKR